MTRLMLALLALLTGLATCGSPAVADVQAHSGAAAAAVQLENAAAETIANAPSGSLPARASDGGVLTGTAWVRTSATFPRSVWLRADRAHE